MPNLETLSIYQAHGSQLKLEMILSFKNLKSLHVNTDGSLCGLVDMLHSLEKMKNLDLSFNISTDEKMRNVEEIDEKQSLLITAGLIRLIPIKRYVTKWP